MERAVVVVSLVYLSVLGVVVTGVVVTATFLVSVLDPIVSGLANELTTYMTDKFSLYLSNKNEYCT